MSRAPHIERWQPYAVPFARLTIHTPLSFADAHARIASLCLSDGLTRDNSVDYPRGSMHGSARSGEVRLVTFGRTRANTYTENFVVEGTIARAETGSVLKLSLRLPTWVNGVALFIIGGLLFQVALHPRDLVPLFVALGAYALFTLSFALSARAPLRVLYQAFPAEDAAPESPY